jgi:hypothetical protein
MLEEGILLREMGIMAPILVLGGIWGDQIPQYLQHDLALTASSAERLEQIEQAAAHLGVRARVHLKIDTGMERIGVHYYNAASLQEAALQCRHIDVEGIYSHFANADSADLTHARLQVERFEQVLRFYEQRSLPVPIRHMANSAAILQLPECPAGPDLEIPGGVFQGRPTRSSGQLWVDLGERSPRACGHGARRVRGWIFPEHVQPLPGVDPRQTLPAGGPRVHGPDHGQYRMGFRLQRG